MAMKSMQERVAGLRPHPISAFGMSLYPFVIAILLAFVMDKLIGPAVGATWAKILLDVGIAILLAGSLNVVNGYAGQFSIGHAGFMLVGGIGNVRGAAAGAMLIAFVEVFVHRYVIALFPDKPWVGQLQDIYVFGILILVLLFKPSGLLGKTSVEKV